jgi:hypothetical protein
LFDLDYTFINQLAVGVVYKLALECGKTGRRVGPQSRGKRWRESAPSLDTYVGLAGIYGRNQNASDRIQHRSGQFKVEELRKRRRMMALSIEFRVKLNPILSAESNTLVGGERMSGQHPRPLIKWR